MNDIDYGYLFKQLEKLEKGKMHVSLLQHGLVVTPIFFIGSLTKPIKKSSKIEAIFFILMIKISLKNNG